MILLWLVFAETTPGFDPVNQLGPIAVLVLPLVSALLWTVKLLLAEKDASKEREREIGQTFLPLMTKMSELLIDVPSTLQQVLTSAQQTKQNEDIAQVLKETRDALQKLAPRK